MWAMIEKLRMFEMGTAVMARGLALRLCKPQVSAGRRARDADATRRPPVRLASLADKRYLHNMPIDRLPRRFPVPTRNVGLTDSQEKLIDELVGSGRYQNASEVLREGLRLIEQREVEEAVKLKALRKAAA